MALGLLGNVAIRARSRAAARHRRRQPLVAIAAIYDAQGTAGSELERELLARVLDPGAPPEVRSAAAHVLRQRGGEGRGLGGSADRQAARQRTALPPASGATDHPAITQPARSRRSRRIQPGNGSISPLETV